VLSARLKVLEEHGLVARRTYSTHPPRDEYILTGKGRDLFPVIAALRRWGARHYTDATLVHAECGHDIELQPHCPHCARDVEPAELTLA
jgi:DNA-binding HxlR family transcriptional regulator